MKRTKYSDVVQAGIEVLDAKVPGWECQLDPDTLDLASCQLCVLGQIYGDYFVGKRALELLDGDAHGFTVKDATGIDREYGFLTRTWLKVLRKRLQNKIDRITGRGV